MKKNLFVLLALTAIMLFAGGLKADAQNVSWKGVDPTSAANNSSIQYYIYNPSKKRYLAQTNDHSLTASTTPAIWTVKKNGDNNFNISNNGYYLHIFAENWRATDASVNLTQNAEKIQIWDSSKNDMSFHIYNTIDFLISKAVECRIKCQNNNNGIGVSRNKADDWYRWIFIPVYNYVAHDGNDYYATFSSSDVTFWPNTSATVYAVSSDGSSLNLAESFESGNIDIANNSVSGHFVPANTGILLKKSQGGNVPYYLIKDKTPTTPTGNMLHPASEPMNDTNSKYYKLAYNDYNAGTGLGFYWGAENGVSFNCKAGTAYLAIPAGSGAKMSFSFSEDTVDGINTINTESKNDGYIYNLAGQRIEAPVRGQMYIKNGRKFIAR